MEPGESFAEAVARELTEETGLVAAPGQLSLWREQWFRYSDLDGPFLYQVWIGATSATDADIVVGEGRQIVFVEPERVPALPLSESTRRFALDFLASREYRETRTPTSSPRRPSRRNATSTPTPG